MSIEVLQGLDGTVMFFSGFESPSKEQRARCEADFSAEERQNWQRRVRRARFASRVREIQTRIRLGMK